MDARELMDAGEYSAAENAFRLGLEFDVKMYKATSTSTMGNEKLLCNACGDVFKYKEATDNFACPSCLSKSLKLM